MFLFPLLFALASSVAFSRDSSLTLGSGSAVPGGTTALNLVLNASTAPSSLQWTLAYNARDVAGITVSAGSAALSAGKTISCNPGNGSIVCITSGMNANAIANGVVGVVNVTLAQSVTSSPVDVGISNALGALPDGSGGAAHTAAGGSITVQSSQSPTTITSLVCTPATLVTPATVTCKVDLTSADSERRTDGCGIRRQC